MFPGTEVEPFIAAPDLEVLVDSVIAGFDEFDPIAIAIREEGLSIACVFETKPFDPLEEELKPHTIAKVTKASPLWRCLTNREYVIQFRQAFWDAFDERQRTAVVHHELTHIDITVDAKGRTRYGTREHDVEDFTQTMRRFGPILPSRAAFVKAFLDWQHEQERPEPTKLRSLDPEKLGDALVDHASDMQTMADELGGDITITANGRSATVSPRERKAACDIARKAVDQAEQTFRDDEGGLA
jgi:hypothetical protein